MPDPFQNTSRISLQGRAEFNDIFKSLFGDQLGALRGAANPLLNAISRQATISGAAAGQDFSAALGSLGGGSTGVGSVSRGLAASLAANQSAQARIGILSQILSSAFSGALSGTQQITGAMFQDIGQTSAVNAQQGGFGGRLLGAAAGAAGGFLNAGPAGAAVGGAAGFAKGGRKGANPNLDSPLRTGSI